MKDVMIDFETLGNGENKCLCQVGAVFFDNVTGELGDVFYSNIDAVSHMQYGAKLDAKTVYWWLQQHDAARQSILAEPRRDVKVVMQALAEYLEPATRIWSHATFDFVTLMETMKQVGVQHKLSYKAGMDIRTLVYLAGINIASFPREGIHHDGLADAKHQVKYVVAALNKVKTNKQAISFLSKLSE